LFEKIQTPHDDTVRSQLTGKGDKQAQAHPVEGQAQLNDKANVPGVVVLEPAAVRTNMRTQGCTPHHMNC